MDTLLPLKLPPGMRNNGTVYQSKDRWYTGNFVRFFQDTIQPIGGWTKVTLTGAAITGIPNAALAFTAVDTSGISTRYIAVGTARGYLYVINTDTRVVTDITPTGYADQYIPAANLVAGRRYRILATGTSDFRLVGASANTVGVEFVATGATTGNGTVADDWENLWQLASFGKYLIAAVGKSDIARVCESPLVWTGDTTANAMRCDSTGVIDEQYIINPSDDPTNVHGCVVTPERFLFAIRGGTPAGTVKPVNYVD